MPAQTGPSTRNLTISRPLPADRQPAAVYLSGLSRSGRVTMRDALDTMARLLSNGRADAATLDWSLLRFQHTSAMRSALSERYRPATINKMLSALRGVLKQAWLLGMMRAEDYQKAVAVKSVPGSTLPRGRELSIGEIGALMKTCAEDLGPEGIRDAALFGLMYTGGLRRAEVRALELSDFDSRTGALTIRGKGSRERTVWVSNGALDALRDWVSARGDEAGPLFWPSGEGEGRPLTNRRMATQSVYEVCTRRAGRAGVPPFSPHDLRRTFVGHLLAAGADIAVVARMAGHSNVQTTARYDRRGEESKQKASGMLHVPYVRRKANPA